LPSELVAQQPFFPKEETKMLLWKNEKISDLQIKNLCNFFEEGDVMVFNDAKVIKAKLRAKIQRSNAEIHLNLDQEIEGKFWQALCRPAKKVKPSDVLEIAPDFLAEVVEKTDDGFLKLRFFDEKNLLNNLEKYGEIPLPPYISRAEKNNEDERNYQTIYANKGTAVAAPTAGLHFDEKLFAQLEAKKIKKVFVTLNVGAGTFLPVRADNLSDHKMHREFFSISENAAKIINEAKKNGKKIIAVGTTSLRALEAAAILQNDEKYIVNPIRTNTEIFIYPPYKFKIVDVLMTNFHLPKSTLFMLICAFVGKENAFAIYNHAIKQHYRFYSYGDSSLLFRN
jgi:S-adenosylmethionine:tRNA ribosyltransferase-isomerase